MAKRFKWNGKAVSAKAKAAQIAGINRVMAKAVVLAKSNHDWANDTGTLEGGIGIADYAGESAKGVRGVWGAKDVKYAAIHELGGTIEPVNAPKLAIPQEDGGVVLVDSVTIPARPYLRPAADVAYPGLAKAIKQAFAA